MNQINVNNIKNMMSVEITDTISKRRKVPYTLQELISKFLKRGEIIVEDFTLSLLNKTDYKDRDYILDFSIVSAAQMSSSVELKLTGIVPVHFDYTSKYNLGLGCGEAGCELFEPTAFSLSLFHFDSETEDFEPVFSDFLNEDLEGLEVQKNPLLVEIEKILKEVLFRELLKENF